mgnify:CR=1 FL=1
MIKKREINKLGFGIIIFIDSVECFEIDILFVRRRH